MISYEPVFKTAAFISGEFIIEFDKGSLDASDTSNSFYDQLIAQIEISTDAGFITTIDNAIISAQDLNPYSLQLNFDPLSLEEAGVKHNDTLYLRYTEQAGLLEGLDGRLVETFDASFTYTLTGPVLLGEKNVFDSVGEDTPYTITKTQLLAGFIDAATGDDSTLTISDLESPNGSFVLNGDDYIFTPDLTSMAF